MAKIYLRMILSGLMTIEQVPALWRAEVERMIQDGE